jgi:hypothetical protein
MNPASAHLDKEEHIQGLQPQRFHREEITGQHLVLMLAQKSSPGAALPGTCGRSRDMLALEDSSNSRAANAIAELEQFSFDFAGSPARVLVSPSAQSVLPIQLQCVACLPFAVEETSICAAPAHGANVTPSRV